MKTQSVSFSITGKLLLAFILVPLIELTLLLQLNQRAGFPTTLLIVVFTGILGVSLARRQGLNVWRAIHQQLAQGKNPSAEIMNGVMVLLAGAFLMTPGLQPILHDVAENKPCKFRIEGGCCTHGLL